MTRRTLLLSSAALAQDSGFNGRWDIDVKTPRGRVWWLEIRGAGTPGLAGSFVGAPGGQVDALPSPRIENGELLFEFTRPGVVQLYRARLDSGRLSGSMTATLNGQPQPPLPFTGVRSPGIPDRDSDAWQPASPVQLVNGKDLGGWSKLHPNGADWTVRNGLLVNEPKASDLVSAATFWNFELRAEYRYEKGSNSGIALRGRYEIQIIDDFSKPPDSHGHGALYSRAAPRVNASRAPGEWQSLQLRLVGLQLSLRLNGQPLHDKLEIPGPTAMLTNPHAAAPGPLVLQGDHGLIEFRSLQVTPLERR